MKRSTTVPLRFALVMTAVLVGCIQPEIYNAITPLTRDVTYTCAGDAMTVLGYTVTKVNNVDPGVLLGDRGGNQHGFSHEGHVDHDQLFVTVMAGDSVSRKLRVTAASVRVITFAFQSGTQKIRPSKEVRGDAGTILAKCARDVKGAP